MKTSPPAVRLHNVPLYTRERLPAMRSHLPSSTGYFVLGLVLGSLPLSEAEEALDALDALVRLDPTRANANLHRALQEMGVLAPVPRASSPRRKGGA